MVRISEDGVDEPIGLLGAEPTLDVQLGQDRPLLAGASRSCFRWKASW